MTKDEALRMAREALELYRGQVNNRGQHTAANAIDAIDAALAQKDEPVAWADDCRLSLVTALYGLASDFENALYRFDGDDEARRAANGSIAHARKVASRWNWNGAAPPQRQPLSDERVHELCEEWRKSRKTLPLLVRAIERELRVEEKP